MAMKMTPQQMAKTPAMKPPPGVIPNFLHPSEQNGPQYIAAMSTLYALAVIFVALRFYSRAAIVKKVDWDDWAVLAAVIVSTASIGILYDVFKTGFVGRHTWDVSLATYANPKIAEEMVVVGAINPFATYFAKMSVMLLLLRLFPRVAFRRIALLTWAGIILNTVFYFSLLIINLAICAPRLPSRVSPKVCTRDVRARIGEANASINAILDIYVLVISLPTLWKLRMNTKRKIGVVVVMGIGLIACVCSVVTWYYRATIDSVKDPSWGLTPVIALGMIEPCVAILSACLPALPALWVHVNSKGVPTLRHIFSRVSLSSNRSQNQSIKSPSGSSYNSLDEKRTAVTQHKETPPPMPKLQPYGQV